MSDYESIRKKANTYFFSKVIVNALLVIIGAVLIGVFLRNMQNDVSIYKQRKNSETALNEAVEVLSSNKNDARELTRIYHDCNQDMVDDLKELFKSGVFSELATASVETRSEVMKDMIERSGVEYLFLMSPEGKILMSDTPEYYDADLHEVGLLSKDEVAKLSRGTVADYGNVDPVLVDSEYGKFYFYSLPEKYEGYPYVIVLGTDASILDVQLESLNDLSSVLSRASVGNEGFMFAVDNTNDTFLYYENDGEILTGTNALDTGLSEEALEDGYSGIQKINGIKYHCVSKSFGVSTIICAVAETDKIMVNDKYVLFWSITGFVLVMLMSLTYAVIVRNDFVRRSVNTEKRVFAVGKGNEVIFDLSIFKKVFPLLLAGVLLIFGISYYTQTLLEISEQIKISQLALDDVSNRFLESTKNREAIENYYNGHFLSKARLVSYLIEEDPVILNQDTDKYYTYFDEAGEKQFIRDDEGNRLRSVSSASRLQELCDANELRSVYIYDEDGHTIATNTANWYFTLSHDTEDQSSVFVDVLDGKKDYLIQETMINDLGESAQYIGVAFNYYTTVDRNGDTLYVSRPAYLSDNSERVHAHRSLIQIELDDVLSEKLLASTDVTNILSSDLLSDGHIVLFDNSEDPLCIYSPNPVSIGRTATEIGVSPKAFTGNEYYGFQRVNGTEYFQYYQFRDNYFIATIFPRTTMYQSRTIVSLITSAASLVLILILTGTVTLTNEEEERLYESMSISEDTRGIDSAIFNIILPSGKSTSTVKAAARWDNRYVSWQERSPEQKLMVMFGVTGSILLLNILISVLGVDTFFGDTSVIKYIISGNWDRGLNIFAFSASVIVLVLTFFTVNVFRIPVRITSSLLGARGETISHLLLSVLKYGGTLGALFYCLYLYGMDATNLLASAGVLSLVIGFGAQSLIKDIIAGIFIVFEGEFRVGDIVTINNFRGTVMDIGLRTTKILSTDGNIKIYNNSEISGVLNMTKEASIAASHISIEYGQDIDVVEEILTRELPLIRESNPKIIDGPEYGGITKLDDSGIDLLVYCKCNEKDVISVTRFMNKELLKIFYKNSINVPFNTITLSNDTFNMADVVKPEKETKKRKTTVKRTKKN